MRANPVVRGFPAESGSGGASEKTPNNLARTDLAGLPRRCQSLNLRLSGFRRYSQIADSNSKNAVSFSSACNRHAKFRSRSHYAKASVEASVEVWASV